MSLGWGIAGCGWVARDYVAPAIAAARNGHLVATYDPDPAARVPGVAAHTGLDAFLAAPGLGAVYVAAPNHAHRALVEAAAASGKPVLCEKPMATTLEDAAAMVAACARAGVLYATAFDQRFHPAHRALARLIAGGVLGTVTAIRIAYACWVDVGWAPDNWRADPRRAGGGALFDLAPHGLDLAAVLLGEPIEEVAALGQARVQDYAVDDGAVLIGRAAGGALLSLHVAYNCPETLPRRRLEVLGTGGQVVATDTMGQTSGGRLDFTDARDGSTHRLAVPDATCPPFLAMVEEYAAHLLGGTRPALGPAHDLHVMSLLARAQAMLRVPPRPEAT